MLTAMLTRIGLGQVGIKAIIVGLTALVLLVILGLIYWHYTGLLDKVSDLTADKQRLELAVERQDRTISTQREAIADWKEHSAQQVVLMEELAENNSAAEAETRRLNELFRKHDLEELARRKPGLVDRRVNDAADRARRLLECASGARHPDC